MGRTYKDKNRWLERNGKKKWTRKDRGCLYHGGASPYCFSNLTIQTKRAKIKAQDELDHDIEQVRLIIKPRKARKEGKW